MVALQSEANGGIVEERKGINGIYFFHCRNLSWVEREGANSGPPWNYGKLCIFNNIRSIDCLWSEHGKGSSRGSRLATCLSWMSGRVCAWPSK